MADHDILTKAEKRRAIARGAGSVLDIAPTLPRRKASPPLPSRDGFAHDSRQTGSDLRTGIERHVDRHAR